MLVFEQLADAATGTKLLRLYSDGSGRSAFILTPSWPRRSDGRPKHVFYSSTAYTVYSPV